MLLVIVGLAAATAEFLLPEMVSKAVAQGMSGFLGTEQTTAKVEKRPAVAMLKGEFDRIELYAQNAKVDKITFSQLDSTLQDVQLDMNELLSHRKVQLKRVGKIDMTAAVTQEELARYLNQNVKGIKNASVNVTSGKVELKGGFALGAIASISVTLEGKIVEDGQKIKFVTERFLLNNSLVGSIGGSTLTEIGLVDIKKLPFGVTVRDITMEPGKVVIKASNGQ